MLTATTMSFFRRRSAPETDEEFVERIRRQMHANRTGPFLLVIFKGLVVLAMAFLIPYSLHTLLQPPPPPLPPLPLEASAYRLSLLVGATVGLIYMLMLWTFCHSLSRYRHPFRIHRLLLKYHDQAGQSPTGSQVEPDPS